MNRGGAEAYEATRHRHFCYLAERLPEFMARLQWSRAQITAEQTRALRELVGHAVAHSPWHRDRLRGVDSDRLTPAELARIPPMTKDDLMAHWDTIITDRRCTLAAAEAHVATLTADAYLCDDLHIIASGGSSGRRGVFVYDWHGWAVAALGLMRGLSTILLSAGGAPGPFVTVSANVASHATSAMGQTFSNLQRPTVRAPVTLPISEIVRLLNAAQPSVLHTYPSMFPVLCEQAQRGHLCIAPVLVWCSSEPLLPEVRRLAENTWKVPITNVWAASESAGAAFNCSLGSGFHIGEDINIIEPVDAHGNPVPPGTRSAKILLTNLYNRVLPLIRYEISDEFTVADAPCPCGSAYLLVADVQGRADDMFSYAGGVKVHPLTFYSPLGKESSILEYQVRQTDCGAAVDIVARSGTDIDALRSSLEASLTALGVRAAHVTIRRVERIERLGTGKLQRFIPLSGGTT